MYCKAVLIIGGNVLGENPAKTDIESQVIKIWNLFLVSITLEFIKASLSNIITNKCPGKKTDAIIIVQSEVEIYKSDNNKEPDKELIKKTVREEFESSI